MLNLSAGFSGKLRKKCLNGSSWFWNETTLRISFFRMKIIMQQYYHTRNSDSIKPIADSHVFAPASAFISRESNNINFMQPSTQNTVATTERQH